MRQSKGSCDRSPPNSTLMPSAYGVMAELVGCQPHNLLTPGLDRDWSWMFVFIFVLCRCCKVITALSVSDGKKSINSKKGHLPYTPQRS